MSAGPHQRSPWFVASGDDECIQCGETIEEDDEARYNTTGEIVCWDCGVVLDGERDPRDGSPE